MSVYKNTVAFAWSPHPMEQLAYFCLIIIAKMNWIKKIRSTPFGHTLIGIPWFLINFNWRVIFKRNIFTITRFAVEVKNRIPKVEDPKGIAY